MVNLTLKKTVKTTPEGYTSLRLDTTGYGLSAKVFAIEVIPKSADPRNSNVRFSHVCSPAELNEFPEDEPGDSCYFRVDSIEMVFDSYDMVEHVMRNMVSDIRKLVTAYNKLETAKPDIEVISF